MYDGGEFEAEQFKHRKTTQRKLREVHSEVTGTMKKTFEVHFDVGFVTCTSCLLLCSGCFFIGCTVYSRKLKIRTVCFNKKVWSNCNWRPFINIFELILIICVPRSNQPYGIFCLLSCLPITNYPHPHTHTSPRCSVVMVERYTTTGPTTQSRWTVW